MWNDTDTPLAYLITFRCYGTWLHGDERGSIDRFHNKFETSYIEADKIWHQFNEKRLKSNPVILSSKQRELVEEAVREVCDYRNWTLFAVNARTNHVHVVVSTSGIKSERALNSFKSYATRKMRENNCWNFSHSPWADKGSRRRLWNERSIALAIDYVINGQGGELPKFD
jgi:REP element-mobilizing transposase RayT